MADRSAAAKKGWKTRRAKMSPEEKRAQAAKKAAETKRAKLTPEERRSQAAKKGWKTRRAKMSPEEKRAQAAKKRAETKRRNTPEFKRRSEAAKKGWKKRNIIYDLIPHNSDKILRAVEHAIETWEPEPYWSDSLTVRKEMDKDMLAGLLANAISEEGRKNVAERLEEHAADGLECAQTILYDSKQERVNQALSKFATIIKGQALDAKESAEINDILADLFE